MKTTKEQIRREVYIRSAGDSAGLRVLNRVENTTWNPELSEDDLTEMLTGRPRPWLSRWLGRYGADADSIERVAAHAGRCASDFVMEHDQEAEAFGELFAMLWWLGTERPRTEYPDIYRMDGLHERHSVKECIRSWAWQAGIKMDLLWEALTCLYQQDMLDFSKITGDDIDEIRRAMKRGKR